MEFNKNKLSLVTAHLRKKINLGHIIKAMKDIHIVKIVVVTAAIVREVVMVTGLQSERVMGHQNIVIRK